MELRDVFVMRRGRREIACKVFSHQSGRELRLLMGPRGDVMLTKVCTSEADELSTAEQWKSAMVDKGWKLQVLT